MVSIDTSAPSESCRPSIHSIACRSLHVPPGELPHRTHIIYTPTNTPPRGRWRPLSSRACSIGPMGGTGPRNTPHHALLAAFRLDLRSPDFALMRPQAKGGGAKIGLLGRALRSPTACSRERMATQHNSAPYHVPPSRAVIAGGRAQNLNSAPAPWAPRPRLYLYSYRALCRSKTAITGHRRRTGAPGPIFARRANSSTPNGVARNEKSASEPLNCFRCGISVPTQLMLIFGRQLAAPSGPLTPDSSTRMHIELTNAHHSAYGHCQTAGNAVMTDLVCKSGGRAGRCWEGLLSRLKTAKSAHKRRMSAAGPEFVVSANSYTPDRVDRSKKIACRWLNRVLCRVLRRVSTRH